MKTLLSLILVLIILVSCQVDNKKATQDSIYMDNILKGEVINFVMEAGKRDIDMDEVTDRVMALDSIIVSSDYPSTLGYFHNNNIYINPYVLNDVLMLRAIMYHELFHATYGLIHCHEMGYDIMCKANGPNWTYGVYLNEAFWQASLDVEFNKIKEL